MSNIIDIRKKLDKRLQKELNEPIMTTKGEILDAIEEVNMAWLEQYATGTDEEWLAIKEQILFERGLDDD
jgi:hypothetical protein|tara:strand:+ start:423 stop:632 length:210 start_codon:yes stop_codon:yes gene_type:complete